MKRLLIILVLFFFPLTFIHGEPAVKVDVFKQQSRAYRQEGYKLQSRGDLQGALPFYQKAMEMDPSYVEAINDVGVVLEALGNQEGALNMYKQVLEVDSNYLPAYTNLAFLYEKRGDIKNATYYWKKRYQLGKAGDYWTEVSRQHLLKLGTYPEVRKDIMEESAQMISREVVYKREQERLQRIEEASLHYNIGAELMARGDYSQAVKELETALSISPPDNELKQKIVEMHKKADILNTKDLAMINTQEALNLIAQDNFLSAGEKLKNALSAVFRIAKDQ
ncbi:MAG: tetratricopeptide repeat protein [Candidatus Omnitrophica bacterium]|nr:tetratricopeptide repeat protein [Candidatus Omnitrophota bacterium]